MNGNDGQGKEVEFLRKRLQQEIDSFRRRRINSRIKAIGVKITVVTLGALATMALGVKGYFTAHWEHILSGFALCSTAAIPILAAWESFFDHRWLWIQYTETLGTLYSISDDLEYAVASGDPLTKDVLDGLYARLQRALATTSAAWSEKRLKDQSAEEQKDKKPAQ
jgi:hypothetical protein